MRRLILFSMIFIFFVSLSFSSEKVRDYLVTGPWYPANAGELQKMLESFFKDAPVQRQVGRVIGIVSPHAGLEYSGRAAARAYVFLKSDPGIDRVVLLGLSHSAPFHGAIVSDFTHFATPLGKLPVDMEAVGQLARSRLFQKNDRIMQAEHSLENQLPFLQYALKGISFKIVPVLFGSLEKDEFELTAKTIAPLLDGKTIVVASSDFTHFGANFDYLPFDRDVAQNLTRLDMGMAETIKKLDFNGYYEYKRKTGITMCGFVPVGVLLKLMEKNKPKVLQTDYYKSGDFNNDYSTSVSYVSLVLCEEKSSSSKTQMQKDDPPAGSLNANDKQLLLYLARRTLEYYFANKKSPTPEDLKLTIPDNLKEKLGVFVTLRQKGELRGCIGYIVGESPLCQGVIENALNAAFNDTRFSPLQKAELPLTDIEVSVLTPLQKIPSYKTIRLKTDGVIIRDGAFQAVFLPQVAEETGWNLDQFLGQLCLKAGLPEDTYRISRTMEFYVFQAQVFEEKPKK